jgi:hypothetical protein
MINFQELPKSLKHFSLDYFYPISNYTSDDINEFLKLNIPDKREILI